MELIRKPSNKQIALITKIEQALEIRFEGKSSKEASDFINFNLPALNAWEECNYEPSKKQRELIKKLELELGIEYKETKNKLEVSNWISNALLEQRRRKQNNG